MISEMITAVRKGFDVIKRIYQQINLTEFGDWIGLSFTIHLIASFTILPPKPTFFVCCLLHLAFALTSCNKRILCQKKAISDETVELVSSCQAVTKCKLLFPVTTTGCSIAEAGNKVL